MTVPSTIRRVRSLSSFKSTLLKEQAVKLFVGGWSTTLPAGQKRYDGIAVTAPGLSSYYDYVLLEQGYSCDVVRDQGL